jgi:tetratricopeptide (TPR) repeat protein
VRAHGSRVRHAVAVLAVAALVAACSATKDPSLIGIRSDAASLEQTSLEYALRGDLPRALLIEEQALRSYRSVDDTAAITGALNRVGNLRQRTGDRDGARAAYLEAQSLAAVTGNGAEEAAARSNLGTLDEEAGDLASADAQYQSAHALAQAAGAKATLATILNNQALLAKRQGNLERAIALLRDALEIDRDSGNDAGVANRLRNLGAVQAAAGYRKEAIASLEEALAIDRRRENVPEIALDLVTLSEVNALDPSTLAAAVSQRRRAADIHRLLGRDDQVARDEAAIAGWCAGIGSGASGDLATTCRTPSATSGTATGTAAR